MSTTPTSEESPAEVSRARRLRRATADLHEALESTPMARRLEEGTVRPAEYGRLHGQLWHLHRFLEERFDSAPSRFDAFLVPDDLRAKLLRRDLEQLNCFPPDPPVAAVRTFAGERTEPNDSLPRLLGFLYVVRGARFGGRVLADRIAEALDVPARSGEGIDYYLAGQDALAEQWRTFRRDLNQLEMAPRDERQLVEGALTLMRHHLEVYRTCRSASRSTGSTDPAD